MRSEFNDALKEALKSGDKTRLATLRLINAAIKDRDIEARGDGSDEGVSDTEILQILSKMVKQRHESAKLYEEAGRLELAESEREELAIIESFLPQKLSEAEIDAAISEIIKSTGAETIRDVGKVMGELKQKFTGQIDLGIAGAKVKAKLS